MSGVRRAMPAWTGPGPAAPPDPAAIRLPAALRRPVLPARAGGNSYRVLAYGAAIFLELLPGLGKTPRVWSGNGSVGSCRGRRTARSLIPGLAADPLGNGGERGA